MSASEELGRAAPRQRVSPLQRFVLRVLLFSSPFLLALGASELFLWLAGESWSITHALSYQDTHPGALFGRKVLPEQIADYKLAMLARHHPRIVALGSSRVMGFRSWMFGPDSASFRNMGGLVKNVADLQQFADSTPGEMLPRVVILGADLRWLNGGSPASDRAPVHGRGLTWQDHVQGLRLLAASPGAARSAASAMVRRARGRGTRGLGLMALANEAGFRPDGSFHWPYLTADRPNGLTHEVLKPTLDHIVTGTRGFERNNGVDSVLLQQLAHALGSLRRRGVFVIGYCPPFASEVAQALRDDPRQSGLLSAFAPAVARQFEANGFPFVDASDLGTLGLDDRYMADGLHGMETMHLYLMRRMLQDSRVRRALRVREDWLEALMADPRTDAWYAAGR